MEKEALSLAQSKFKPRGLQQEVASAPVTPTDPRIVQGKDFYFRWAGA
jgi:hypothetical protein